MPVTLSKPGPLWYRAVLQSVSPGTETGTIVGSFQVIDSAGDYHNGLSLDGIPQPLLDVLVDMTHGIPRILSLVMEAVQALVIAEYGGDLQAVIQAVIDQGVDWK